MLYFLNDRNERLIEIEGLEFKDITNKWEQNYTINMINESKNDYKVVSYAVSDNSILDQNLFLNVEIDGVEIVRRMSFAEWISKGFEFDLNWNQVIKLKLKFHAEKLSESLMGVGTNYDFEFGFKDQ